MKRLTEEMVIARTKISDLGCIKRLNCWGSELTDVSLLRRMNSVEVLSLSINKINSLSDFQFCRGLKELYVRQNNIKDLNEICYLQELPNLKNLWLGENPCATSDGYRLTVLRALPKLQKLDDVAVTPEELSEAHKRGQALVHPEDDNHTNNSHGDYYAVRSQPIRTPQSSPEISPIRTEPIRPLTYEPENDPDYYNDVEDTENEREAFITPNGQESPPRRHDTAEQRRLFSPEPDTSSQPGYHEDRRNANNYENDSPRQSRHYQFDRSPVSSSNNTDENGITPDSPKEERLPHSTSVQSMKEYTNGDRFQTYTPYRQNDGGSDGSNHSQYDHQQTSPPRPGQPAVRGDRCERPACTATHRPPFHRRPVTRNSNILSAVLCLVKELDYPSLEVVEMAVRCRMDELED